MLVQRGPARPAISCTPPPLSNHLTATWAPTHKRSLTLTHAQEHKACDVTDHNFAAALVMYGSYLCLFVYFALEKYLYPSQSKGKKGGKGDAKAGTAAAGSHKRSTSVGKSKGQ